MHSICCGHRNPAAWSKRIDVTRQGSSSTPRMKQAQRRTGRIRPAVLVAAIEPVCIRIVARGNAVLRHLAGRDRSPPTWPKPVAAGGFVRRVARTPHYDGVRKTAVEPAVVTIFGIAPVQFQLVDASKAVWRKV
jgi:hypothetical protein